MPVIEPNLRRRLRDTTPSADRLIYLNHASAGLVSARVTEVLASSARLDSEVGVNEAMRTSQDELNAARTAVAGLLGTEERNIALMETTASAWAAALAALTIADRKLRLVTVRNEWGPNILTARAMVRRGLVDMSVESSGAFGRFDPLVLAAAAVNADVVSVPLIPVSSGLVNPVSELRSALSTDTLLFVDAAQAIGQMPVLVRELGADVLVFPARKWLRGPKGIAVLYLSDRALERMAWPFFIDQGGGQWSGDSSFTNHPDARRFERFDFYPGLRLGLKTAIEEANEVGLTAIEGTIAELGEAVKEAFGRHSLPKLFEQGHLRGSGLFSFTCPEISARADIDFLRDRGLAIAGVGPNYARLALADRGAEIIVRLSVHYLNVGEEIDNAAKILAEFIRLRRK